MNKMKKKMTEMKDQKMKLEKNVTAISEDKGRLISLVKDEILNGSVELVNGQDMIDQFKKGWRELDEKNMMTLSQLQNEFKSLAQKQNQQQTAAANGAENTEKMKESAEA